MSTTSMHGCAVLVAVGIVLLSSGHAAADATPAADHARHSAAVTHAPMSPPAAASRSEGVCRSATDCNLNGECESTGTCKCYAPWGGATCGVLKTLPIPGAVTPEGYGMRPNLTSWGGQVVEQGGKYHLFAAQMVEDCPLNTWGTNSECIHAVADDIMGPYLYSDTAVPVWCHNPQIVQYTKPSGATAYALFHIGTGTVTRPPKNCTAKHIVTPAPVSSQQRRDWRLGQAGQGEGGRLEGGGGTAGGGTLHLADSPYGPWTAVTTTPGCNNPAPFRHRNGTWFLVCTGHIMYRAEEVTGPWVVAAKVDSSAGVQGSYEHPFLWVDAQDRWHVIYHVYNATTPCGACDSPLVSGHRFSEDGLTWVGSSESPYVHTAAREDGSVLSMATRERPKLVLSETGVPSYLLNGVCGGTATCPPVPSVNCKYNYWDFTLIQQLDLSSEQV